MTKVTDANQQANVKAEDINAAVAKQVAELVRSTLGPMGRDKMLVDNAGRTVITNDGATILRETNFVHPTARMMIEVARTQEEECFDGTTTAIIVTGALMREAEELLQKKITAAMLILH